MILSKNKDTELKQIKERDISLAYGILYYDDLLQQPLGSAFFLMWISSNNNDDTAHINKLM